MKKLLAFLPTFIIVFVVALVLGKALNFVVDLAPQPFGKLAIWSLLAWMMFDWWREERDRTIEAAKREARIKASQEWVRRRNDPAVQKSMKRHRKKLSKCVRPFWSKEVRA